MLIQLHQKISECKDCPLHKTLPCGATPVPGIGSADAKIMLVGEAPGWDEIMECEPFVGMCGKYLNEKLLPSAGIKREDCYICNTVNCWVRNDKNTSNRPSKQSEIKDCKKWLWKQILTVKPKVIVTLGGVPTKTLLSKKVKNTTAMKNLVGKTFEVDYCDAKILPNYHPSFVHNRDRSKEKLAIDIFKQAKELL